MTRRRSGDERGRQLVLLQALRLKGRASPGQLEEVTGLGADAVERGVAALVAGGLAEQVASGCRLTGEGRDALERALGEERAGLDPAAVRALYDEFCVLNDAFKQLVTDWQLRADRPGQVLNDHTDPSYDAGVLARLAAVHEQADDLLGRVAAAVPRLARYRARLAAAHAAVAAGDHRYVAAPVLDSYHTIWFELHEELIVVDGRTRAREAEAGRAV